MAVGVGPFTWDNKERMRSWRDRHEAGNSIGLLKGHFGRSTQELWPTEDDERRLWGFRRDRRRNVGVGRISGCFQQIGPSSRSWWIPCLGKNVPTPTEANHMFDSVVTMVLGVLFMVG